MPSNQMEISGICRNLDRRSGRCLFQERCSSDPIPSLAEELRIPFAKVKNSRPEYKCKSFALSTRLEVVRQSQLQCSGYKPGKPVRV